MTETRTHNAKDILTEARDTIKATYWIQEAEVTFAHAEQWSEHTKGILAELDDEHWVWDSHFRNPEAGGKAKVVGVCSVGAIALANVTLYDEPLVGFDAIVLRDVETWKAAQALAQAINEDFGGYRREECGPIIAGWNDEEGRTRDEVLSVFDKALNSPLLDATEFYVLVADKYYGQVSSHHYFASEQAAQQFIDTPSQLRNFLCLSMSVEATDLQVKPYTHVSLVQA